MITAALAFVFVYSLFYGRIPQPCLLLICAGLGTFLAITGRHRHSSFMPIDVLAQSSKLKDINPALKFWTILTLLIICVTSNNGFTGIFLLIAAGIFAAVLGGIRIQQYVRIISIPVSFLLIGCIALLFEASSAPDGVLNLNIFGIWFCVSDTAQARTALVVVRAAGAVSCLCLMSITTPMSDIIGVLRRCRCPELIIDMMYLIYRYIFILLSLHKDMRNAAKSRLAYGSGFRDYRTGMRATAMIYANLLARSYQFAGRNFDAMESRCYDTGIMFLETRHKINFRQGVVSASAVLISLGLGFLLL